MKNIRIPITLSAVAIAIFFASCKKDFITLQPRGQFLSENYYTTSDQAYSALVGVYDVLRKNAGGFENMITMMNAGSDDNYAGGGGPSDGAGIQGFSNYTLDANIMPGSFWNDHYQGIFRANGLLLKLPDIDMDPAMKARFTAEAKALRATYYFNLVRMFRNIPLILDILNTNTMYDVVQAKPEEVYAQIEKDLTEAIPDLPGILPDNVKEAGRFTKGAAQAMLGKVYLYENKNALAAAQLAEVNGTPGETNQYGNRLLDKFSDLWVFTNKFNPEGILVARHTDQSNADWGFWGSGADEGNSVNQMVGPRSYSRKSPSAPDIPSGWSFNVFTQDFINLIKNDPRYSATVLDMNALKADGLADYIGGYQNTGYFLNKFIPRSSDVRKGGGAMELNFQQDDYIIRLADTYLMEAEALGATGARAQALLDAVRKRAGVATVPVSMDAIKTERRIELAGEGHRFFDLVRWGDAAAKLGSRGFKPGKNEIFPIPFIELQGTKLVQNPNYN